MKSVILNCKVIYKSYKLLAEVWVFGESNCQKTSFKGIGRVTNLFHHLIFFLRVLTELKDFYTYQKFKINFEIKPVKGNNKFLIEGAK